MAGSSDVYSSDVSDVTEFSSESGRSYDTLDELLSRFTLEFKPEYVIKFRNRLGPLIIGADASHNPDLKESSGALLLKPVNRAQWWRRFRADTSGMVSLRSRKLRWWVLTLDLEGHVNPICRTTSASFRVATKWDIARGEYRNKRRWALGDATEGRVHWNVNYNLPEVAGSFGTGDRQGTAARTDMHAEVGYAHAEVSKVELVVWPLRNNPKLTRREDEERVVGNATEPLRLLVSMGAEPVPSPGPTGFKRLESHISNLRRLCDDRWPWKQD